MPARWFFFMSFTWAVGGRGKKKRARTSPIRAPFTRAGTAAYGLAVSFGAAGAPTDR